MSYTTKKMRKWINEARNCRGLIVGPSVLRVPLADLERLVNEADSQQAKVEAQAKRIEQFQELYLTASMVVVDMVDLELGDTSYCLRLSSALNAIDGGMPEDTLPELAGTEGEG